MAVRTNENSVKAILMADYDTMVLPPLDPFIETASATVDDIAAYASSSGLSISSTRLELIERWLAAHCYGLSDQPYTYKQTKAVSANFQGKTDMFLKATKYGQHAVLLDTTGYLYQLAEGSQGVTLTAYWLGKVPSAQVPYDQRD